MTTSGYGTKIEYGDGATVAASTTWAEITGVDEITPSEVSVSATNTRHLQSASQAVTKKASWKEAGDVSLALFYDKAQMAALYALAGASKGWRVTLAVQLPPRSRLSALTRKP